MGLPNFFEFNRVGNLDNRVVISDVVIENLVEASTILTSNFLPALPIQLILLSKQPVRIFNVIVAFSHVV